MVSEKSTDGMTSTIIGCNNVPRAMMVSVEIGIFAHYKQMRQANAKRRKQAVVSLRKNFKSSTEKSTATLR